MSMSSMSPCPIRGVRSVELIATNLDEAARFYETVWNLTPVETRNDSRYFRGTGRYHHVLALHDGARPAVARIVFDVADRASVDALHGKVAAAGGKPTAPAKLTIAGGGYGFACKDPDAIFHPSARLSRHRRQCAAVVPALRQFRPLLDRFVQAQFADAEPHRVRHAGIRFGDAGHGADEGCRLSDRMGAGPPRAGR